MSRHWQPLLLTTFSVVVVPSTLAQPASSPSAPAGQLQVTTSPTPSALESYRPFTEEKILPWKQANETVGAIGGWKAYAKEAAEARQSQDQPSPPTRPQTTPSNR
jgi:hypothetical protein